MATYKRYSFTFILLVSCLFVSAQTESVSKSIQVLTNLWKKSYLPVDTMVKWQDAKSVFEIIENGISTPNSTKAELERKIKMAEADNLHHDPSLKIGANYLENFTPALNEDDDNLIYNRRVQTGITWDILNDGMIDHRMREKILRNEIKLDKTNGTVTLDKKSYTEKWNRIIYLFNTEKIRLLDERVEVLNEMVIEAENLYLLKFISREKYIAILTRKTEVESMYRIYAGYNLAFENMNDSVLKKVPTFPVFDVNYDTLLSLMGAKTNADDSAMILFSENERIEQKMIRDITLNTSLRYNYYNLVTDNPSSRQFLTFGINFSMPLPFNYKQKKELAMAKSAYARYTHEHQNEEYSREVLNDCYEYRYKLKQYEGFYQKKLLLEEKLRKLNALKDINELHFNPLEALNTLDEYKAVEIELIDLKQNLYLKFLRINSYFSLQLSDDYTHDFALPVNFELDEAINRSVYIWSSALDDNSDFFIREYLVYNKFENAIISIKSDTTYLSKFNSMTAMLVARNITVEAMIGDNSLINEKDFAAEIDSKMAKVDLKNITTLHLDVEPHTFDDWDAEKANYMMRYLNMVKEARIWCDLKGLELSISIPLHYPEETVKHLFPLCDHIYFMAYENTKTEYIQRKLEPFAEFNEKIIVAISAKDFEQRPLLEQQLMDLYRLIDVNHYAIHDLKRLLDLDEQNIEEKK